MNQIKLINLENTTDEEALSYRTREAARAVIFDANDQAALLYSTINDYYKLPGGGIEKGESPEIALVRECKEEIGCDVEITRELGIIVEYRKLSTLKQISYCYIAKVKGEKGIPQLTEDEIDEGFETRWLSLKDALKVSKIVGDPTVYEANYMANRDSSFIEEALKVLWE
jgi:8-oxo-dGTP pyrophosphatase MutT (NUDIX family)